MTLNDLKGTRSAHYEEFVAVGQKADSEGRTLTEAEQERCDKLDGLISDLDSKIKHKEREQQMVARMAQTGNAGTSEKREVERVNGSFSLSRAVEAVSNGQAIGRRRSRVGKRSRARNALHRACSLPVKSQFLPSLCVQEVLTISKQEAATVQDSFQLLYLLQLRRYALQQ